MLRPRQGASILLHCYDASASNWCIEQCMQSCVAGATLATLGPMSRAHPQAASVANQKFATYLFPSFPRKRESIGFENKWIPARARLRGLGRNDGNLCSELAKRHTNRRPSRQLGWSI